MSKDQTEQEALLNRAYNLSNDQETRELYRDWADTYDHTMLEGLGYLSPVKMAAMLSTELPERNVEILDVGSGTGLAGENLASMGYSRIDALDYSAEMLTVASRKGVSGNPVYRRTIEADLNKPLALENAVYDGLICTGTFTHAHVNAGCLSELFRILRVGGLFACTVHFDVWDKEGFSGEVSRLENADILRKRKMTKGKFFATDHEPQGWFIVWEKCG